MIRNRKCRKDISINEKHFTTEKKIKHKIHFNSKNSDLKIRKEKKSLNEHIVLKRNNLIHVI